MTLAIVDPLGAYNSDNGTSWVANDAGAKCIYLQSASEIWLLLETGTGPTASGSNSTNSHFLRIDETTGDYIDMADDPAGQSGKLFLWGPAVADDVNQLVIVAGNYVTTSGGTTIGGNCIIAWNYDGTIAWENFFANSGGFPNFEGVYHLIYNPTLGTLYGARKSNHPTTRLVSINISTGALTTITTYWDVTGSYRPVMDNNGDVWLGYGASPTYEDRHTLTVPSVTTIENVGGINGRQMYDEINDIVYWYVPIADDIRYWNGSSVVNMTSPPTDTYFSSPGGSGVAGNVYQQYASHTGYWTATRDISAPRDLYFKDLSTFVTVKKVTEPADTYSTEYAASGLKYQFATSYTRAWWRIKQTTWKLLVWTDAVARRRVSVCVIT